MAGKALNQQLPEFILIETNDILETVLVTGYLNSSHTYFQFPYNNQQMALVYTTDQGPVWLAVAVTGTAPNYQYSLKGTTNVSTVYEASNGSAAAPSYTFVSDTTTGMYLASAGNLGLTAAGAQVANLSATGLAVTGLISATTSVTALGGALTSGVTGGGTVGTLKLFPTTASKGFLAITATANTANGDTVTVTNAAFGQATTLTIPNPGAASANFLLSATASTIKKVSKAAVAGGAASQTVTDAAVSATSVVLANWNDITNACEIETIAPGNGSFVVVSTADPGASHISYIVVN